MGRVGVVERDLACNSKVTGLNLLRTTVLVISLNTGAAIAATAPGNTNTLPNKLINFH